MRKMKALLGGLAIAAILGANGYVAVSSIKAAPEELTLDGVEYVAEGESAPWNGFFTWFSQGLRADESNMYYTCYVTNGHYSENFTAAGTGSSGGNGYSVNGDVKYSYSNSHDYSCSYTAVNCGSGYENCSRVKCN